MTPPPYNRKRDLAAADGQEEVRRVPSGSKQGVHSTAASDPTFNLGTLPPLQPSAEVDEWQLGGKRRGGNWRAGERANGGVTTSSDAPLPKTRQTLGSVDAVFQQYHMAGATTSPVAAQVLAAVYTIKYMCSLPRSSQQRRR